MWQLNPEGFAQEAEQWLESVEYPGMAFLVKMDSGRPYLQLECDGLCNDTGEPIEWRGRKWMLSTFMTKSEVVGTAFLAVATALEHEAREKFKYKGESIYSPHYDVDKLAQLRADPDSQETRDG